MASEGGSDGSVGLVMRGSATSLGVVEKPRAEWKTQDLRGNGMIRPTTLPFIVQSEEKALDPRWRV